MSLWPLPTACLNKNKLNIFSFLFWLLIPESGPAYPGGARLPHPFTQRAPAGTCVAAAVQRTSAYHGLPTDSYRGQHSDTEFPEVPLSQRSVADYLRQEMKWNKLCVTECRCVCEWVYVGVGVRERVCGWVYVGVREGRGRRILFIWCFTGLWLADLLVIGAWPKKISSSDGDSWCLVLQWMLIMMLMWILILTMQAVYRVANVWPKAQNSSSKYQHRNWEGVMYRWDSDIVDSALSGLCTGQTVSNKVHSTVFVRVVYISDSE